MKAIIASRFRNPKLLKQSFVAAFRSYFSILGILVAGVSLFNLFSQLIQLKLAEMMLPLLSSYYIVFHKPLVGLFGLFGIKIPATVVDLLVIYLISYLSVMRLFISLPPSHSGERREIFQWETELNERLPYFKACVVTKVAVPEMSYLNDERIYGLDWRLPPSSKMSEKQWRVRKDVIRKLAFVAFAVLCAVAWPSVLTKKLRTRYLVHSVVSGAMGGESYFWSKYPQTEDGWDSYNEFEKVTILDARTFYLFQLVAMIGAATAYTAVNAYAV